MPRLTVDLVRYADTYLNPIRQLEIALRGYQIPSIENLGLLEDGYDSVDLSDNSIVVLENFPPMKRITNLLFHNNKIRKIASQLGTSLPNLENLMLNNNHIYYLSDLESLEDLPSLVRLSLLGNPVTKENAYRLYVIARLPNLKMLDFIKVRPEERKEAIKIFGHSLKSTKAVPPQPDTTPAVAPKVKIVNLQPPNRSVSRSPPLEHNANGANNVTPMDVDSTNDTMASAATATAADPNSNLIQTLTAEQKLMIQKAIMSTKTGEEADRLEKMLLSGQIPTDDWKKFTESQQQTSAQPQT